MTKIQSAFMRLSRNDFAKALVMAFVVPIIVYLGNTMQAPGFAFNQLDFLMLLKLGLYSALGYLAKNLMTTSDGKFLGKIG